MCQSSVVQTIDARNNVHTYSMSDASQEKSAGSRFVEALREEKPRCPIFKAIMPFYIRKSISVGPFRVNLSKSGLGVSAGIKGLRFGTGPRGHYIHAGMNGIYYRKTLGGVAERRKAARNPVQEGHAELVDVTTREKLPSYITEDGVLMQRIVSAEADLLVAESHADALVSLNEARGRVSMTAVFTVLAGLLVGLSLWSGQTAAVMGSAVVLVLAWMAGSRMDASRRNVVFAYELDSSAEERYRELVEAIDAAGKSRVLQYVKAQGDITSLHAWKKNSGASSIIDTGKTSITYSMPPGVASNVTPPAIKIDGKSCYFFPDCMLILEGRTYGAVRYEELRTDVRDQRMILDSAPSDATTVGETWKFVNKKGGPDRRFKDNRRLPICLFEELGLVSSNGFKALLQVSRHGALMPVNNALHGIGRISKEKRNAEPLVLTHDQ